MEKYQVLRLIHENAFSSIYKGQHSRNLNFVAIKQVHTEFYEILPKETIPIAVSKEINILAGLKHKNIVILLDVLVESYGLYMIFELLTMDLSTYLHVELGSNPMDPALLKSYLCQLNDAITFCHERNVIHRCIQPSNILLSNNGVIKLADFHSAVNVINRSVKEYARDSLKLSYRPPEILLGSRLQSYPFDIWSLGCVFAQMASNSVLFSNTSNNEQLSRIFQVLTTPTEETWPGVSSFRNYRQFPTIQNNCLKEKVPQLDECGLDLLRSMLVLDPKKRITAQGIAKHAYLSNVDVTVQPTFKTA